VTDIVYGKPADEVEILSAGRIIEITSFGSGNFETDRVG
jgi:hypothetical protein